MVWNPTGLLVTLKMIIAMLIVVVMTIMILTITVIIGGGWGTEFTCAHVRNGGQ